MNGHKVLIVEDHADTAEILTRFIERAGGSATSVSDGNSALALLRSDPHDAVVLDCHLPGLNGMDVLRAMRGDDRLRDVPVLVYSADNAPAKRQLAYTLGAQAYLVKGDAPWSSVITQIDGLTGPIQ